MEHLVQLIVSAADGDNDFAHYRRLCSPELTEDDFRTTRSRRAVPLRQLSPLLF